MNYKMIILDLDDTLLMDDGSISKNNKDCILRAMEKGVYIVLASGRPTFAMKYVADELNLKNKGYTISYNGARIINWSNQEIIYKADITREQVKKIYDFAKSNNAFMHTYDGDNIITEKSNKYTEIESKITKMPILEKSDFKNSLPENLVKLLILEAPEYLQEIEIKAKNYFGNEMYITRTKPFFLEFMNIEVDKGKSILRLCEKLNINREEIIAIGDSYNDLGMIQTAGLGIAMGNAVEEIKEIADYITDTNMNDGVAKAIEKFILN